jgi:hypothetical protein
MRSHVTHTASPPTPRPPLQPRAAVWAAFDTCTLLSGGLLMYTGACGGVVPWFESIGMGPWRSDVHGTACDWVMDLVNIGFANKPHVSAPGRLF